MKRLCDFCNKPDPTHVFQGDGMVMLCPDAPQEQFPPMDLSGAWHACDPCAAFVRRRDMEGLIAHILPKMLSDRIEQRGGDLGEGFEVFMKDQLRAMYAGLFGQLDEKRSENN